MRLEYDGKISINDLLGGPPAKFSEEVKDSKSALICGDNLSSMLSLINSPTRFDLCYIDPPFATGNTFRTSSERTATVSKSSKDEVAYSDNIKGSKFIEFVRQRAILARELLSDRGSFYLHIDYKVGHYVKVVLDEVFGPKNFKNDIARIKCNPKNFSRNAFGNVKDLILFYTKTDKSIWNDPVTPLSEEDTLNLFKKVSKGGRRYTTVPLHAPGETMQGPTGEVWEGLKPPAGRHWRSSPDELDRLNKEGLIEWSSSGNPRKIIYADEHKGKKVQDIWLFKDSPYPSYPTEKNLELLKFIVEASSDKESRVLDCFCGSGTTLVASEMLGRKWVGIDESKKAIEIAEARLNDLAILSENLDFQRITATKS